MPRPPSPALLHAVVFHQLDDLNGLGDALRAASVEGDSARIATLLVTMDRFVVALAWRTEAVLPLVLAYLEARARFADDLFAPAFVLAAIVPDDFRTAALLARLSPDVADLLALATRRYRPRP